tara:strand:+ start:251 stop:472 length:222 start_codon:yes stop_codon:yes gene_type:complete
MPTKLVENPYNSIKHEARFINYYECDKCGCEWEDEYDCQPDDDCPNCGTNMSPVRSEDHPDYEPREDKENKHD